MARINLEGSRLDDIRIMTLMRLGVNIQTLAGTYTMDHEMPPVQFLDPGGAGRQVVMPGEADSRGLVFIIVNKADAAEDLTIRNSANAVTIGTISQSEMAILVCDGTTWSIGVGTTT